MFSKRFRYYVTLVLIPALFFNDTRPILQKIVPATAQEAAAASTNLKIARATKATVAANIAKAATFPGIKPADLTEMQRLVGLINTDVAAADAVSGGNVLSKSDVATINLKTAAVAGNKIKFDALYNPALTTATTMATDAVNLAKKAYADATSMIAQISTSAGPTTEDKNALQALATQINTAATAAQAALDKKDYAGAITQSNTATQAFAQVNDKLSKIATPALDLAKKASASAAGIVTKIGTMTGLTPDEKNQLQTLATQITTAAAAAQTAFDKKDYASTITQSNTATQTLPQLNDKFNVAGQRVATATLDLAKKASSDAANLSTQLNAIPAGLTSVEKEKLGYALNIPSSAWGTITGLTIADNTQFKNLATQTTTASQAAQTAFGKKDYTTAITQSNNATQAFTALNALFNKATEKIAAVRKAIAAEADAKQSRADANKKYDAGLIVLKANNPTLYNSLQADKNYTGLQDAVAQVSPEYAAARKVLTEKLAILAAAQTAAYGGPTAEEAAASTDAQTKYNEGLTALKTNNPTLYATLKKNYDDALVILSSKTSDFSAAFNTYLATPPQPEQPKADAKQKYLDATAALKTATDTVNKAQGALDAAVAQLSPDYAAAKKTLDEQKAAADAAAAAAKAQGQAELDAQRKALTDAILQRDKAIQDEIVAIQTKQDALLATAQKSKAAAEINIAALQKQIQDAITKLNLNIVEETEKTEAQVNAAIKQVQSATQAATEAVTQTATLIAKTVQEIPKMAQAAVDDVVQNILTSGGVIGAVLDLGFPAPQLKEPIHNMDELNKAVTTILPVPALRNKIGTLFLEENMITELTDNFFAIVPNIQSIHLDDNGLTTVWPKAFANLKSLEYLDLGKNYISKLPMEVFEGLDKLKIVFLGFNPISDIRDNAAMAHVSELKKKYPNVLFVWRSPISQGVNAARSLVRAQLYLKNKGLFSGDIKQSIMHLIRKDIGFAITPDEQTPYVKVGQWLASLLCKWGLNDLANQIGSITAIPLLAKVLNLANQDIKDVADIETAAIDLNYDPKNFETVTHLILANNYLKKIPNGYFQTKFPKLQLIDLSGNNITEIGSDAFTGLPELNYLLLGSNPNLDYIPVSALLTTKESSVVKMAPATPTNPSTALGKKVRMGLKWLGLNETKFKKKTQGASTEPIQASTYSGQASQDSKSSSGAGNLEEIEQVYPDLLITTGAWGKKTIVNILAVAGIVALMVIAATCGGPIAAIMSFSGGTVIDLFLQVGTNMFGTPGFVKLIQDEMGKALTERNEKKGENSLFAGRGMRSAKKIFRIIKTGIFNSLGWDVGQEKVLDLTNALLNDTNEIAAKALEYYYDPSNFNQVTVLRLARNNFTKIGADAFKLFPNVKTINLAGNLITKIEPRAFADLKKLETIYLDENDVTEFPVTAIDGCDSIEFIQIGRNPIAAGYNIYSKADQAEKNECEADLQNCKTQLPQLKDELTALEQSIAECTDDACRTTKQNDYKEKKQAYEWFEQSCLPSKEAYAACTKQVADCQAKLQELQKEIDACTDDACKSAKQDEYNLKQQECKDRDELCKEYDPLSPFPRIYDRCDITRKFKRRLYLQNSNFSIIKDRIDKIAERRAKRNEEQQATVAAITPFACPTQEPLDIQVNQEIVCDANRDDAAGDAATPLKTFDNSAAPGCTLNDPEFNEQKTEEAAASLVQESQNLSDEQAATAANANEPIPAGDDTVEFDFETVKKYYDIVKNLKDALANLPPRIEKCEGLDVTGCKLNAQTGISSRETKRIVSTTALSRQNLIGLARIAGVVVGLILLSKVEELDDVIKGAIKGGGLADDAARTGGKLAKAIDAMTPDELGALDDAARITPKQLENLDVVKLQRLKPKVISELSDEQVIVLKLANLKDEQLEALTYGQIQTLATKGNPANMGMDTEQFNFFKEIKYTADRRNYLRLKPDDKLKITTLLKDSQDPITLHKYLGLTPEERRFTQTIKNTDDLKNFLNKLPEERAAIIKTGAPTTVTPPAVSKPLGQMTVDEIRALTDAQLAKIDLASLSDDEIKALGSDKIDELLIKKIGAAANTDDVSEAAKKLDQQIAQLKERIAKLEGTTSEGTSTLFTPEEIAEQRRIDEEKLKLLGQEPSIELSPEARERLLLEELRLDTEIKNITKQPLSAQENYVQQLLGDQFEKLSETQKKMIVTNFLNTDEQAAFWSIKEPADQLAYLKMAPEERIIYLNLAKGPLGNSQKAFYVGASHEERALFTALDPKEQAAFWAIEEPVHQLAYLKMTPEERVAYLNLMKVKGPLANSQKAFYAGASHEERTFFATLDPREQEIFASVSVAKEARPRIAQLKPSVIEAMGPEDIAKISPAEIRGFSKAQTKVLLSKQNLSAEQLQALDDQILKLTKPQLEVSLRPEQRNYFNSLSRKEKAALLELSPQDRQQFWDVLAKSGALKYSDIPETSAVIDRYLDPVNRSQFYDPTELQPANATLKKQWKAGLQNEFSKADIQKDLLKANEARRLKDPLPYLKDLTGDDPLELLSYYSSIHVDKNSSLDDLAKAYQALKDKHIEDDWVVRTLEGMFGDRVGRENWLAYAQDGEDAVNALRISEQTKDDAVKVLEKLREQKGEAEAAAYEAKSLLCRSLTRRTHILCNIRSERSGS